MADTALKDVMNDDTKTLEEKLAAIEAAMAAAQAVTADNQAAGMTSAAPIDPYDSLMCDSCQ
jgi:hypothetical protein